MRHFLLSLILVLSLANLSFGSTEAVRRDTITGILSNNIVVGNGNSLTANVGSTLTLNGTVTGTALGVSIQPYDSDLASIAALTTTTTGRSLLAAADAAAIQTIAGTVIGTNVQAFDSDLTSIAALTTTSFGRSVLALADAAAMRTLSASASLAANTFTGIQTITSAVTTGTTTSSGFVFTGNSLTTGTGLYLASSSLSSGKMVDIALTGTAAATGHTGINVALSGASNSASTNGIVITNSRTGTSSFKYGMNIAVSGSGSSNRGLTISSSGATSNLAIFISSGAFLSSTSGTASTPAMQFGGSWATGADGTTRPYILVESASTSNGWSTAGTGIGLNPGTGFAGNFVDFQVEGVSKFKVDYTGAVTMGNVLAGSWNGTAIAVNKGGTGQTSYTDGQILIGNTSTGGLTKANIVAGSNVTVTNGNGSITISSTGGSGSPAGSSGQFQYNNAGAFGGISGVTTDGTNIIIASGKLSLSGNSYQFVRGDGSLGTIDTGVTPSTTADSAEFYPLFVASTSGSNTVNVKSSGFTFNPSGGGILTAGAFQTSISSGVVKSSLTGNAIYFYDASDNIGTFTMAGLTSSPTWTLPDEGGTFLLNSATQTMTNKTIGAGELVLAENASIALDPANSGDDKYTGITITGTAGADLAFGDLIYLDPTDSRWEKTDANEAAGADGDARAMIGLCVNNPSGDGDPVTILLMGVVRWGAPGWTINGKIFVSETPGAVTQTAPSTGGAVVRALGSAMTADEMYFNPSPDYFTN